MPQQDDELTPHQVARRLNVHRDTVYRWCEKAKSGEPSPLSGRVRQDALGFWYIRDDGLGRIDPSSYW